MRLYSSTCMRIIAIFDVWVSMHGRPCVAAAEYLTDA